jgi:hypothetical protein
LDQAVNSLHKFASRSPSGLALAHYGLLGDPDGLLEEAESSLRQWAETAEAAWRGGEDITEALTRRFGGPIEGVAEEHRAKLETLNGIHSNAAGLQRWLETTKADGAHTHTH